MSRRCKVLNWAIWCIPLVGIICYFLASLQKLSDLRQFMAEKSDAIAEIEFQIAEYEYGSDNPGEMALESQRQIMELESAIRHWSPGVVVGLSLWLLSVPVGFLVLLRIKCFSFNASQVSSFKFLLLLDLVLLFIPCLI
jgi:hypothetical protein